MEAKKENFWFLIQRKKHNMITVNILSWLMWSHKPRFYFIELEINIQSNLCTTATLGTQKVAVVKRVAVVQGLVQSSRLGHSRFSRAGDLGWSLLTGGRCSEVAVSTGLTVLLLLGKCYQFLSFIKRYQL